ncbi:MAG: hypothetical protein MJ009_07625, partial [Paludibacteraceae bacterium]|nr:hypothetical protein [Paludibacteraceae bacterium]
GTDGEKLINKLEKNSWEYSSSGYGYDEYYIYTKQDEMCEINLGDDEVYAVSWISYYTSFSDAVTALCDYHDAAKGKAKDDYGGQYEGYSTKEFSEPSEFIKYIKAVKESDMKNAAAGEYFINTKNEYLISLYFGYASKYKKWVLMAAISFE